MTPRRILHATFAVGGGAGIAAERLRSAQEANGFESDLLTFSGEANESHKVESNWVPKITCRLGRLSLRRYTGRNAEIWTNNLGWGKLPKSVVSSDYDIINLHWLGEGFIPVNLIDQINVPIVWTLHDMWCFTGGCHYDRECAKYRKNCGACPQLDSRNENDLSRKNWKVKSKAFRAKQFHVVTPSQWLADCAKESALLSNHPVRAIFNTLDVDQFSPQDKLAARKALGIPLNANVVLLGSWGADPSPRKGAQFLKAIQESLKKTNVPVRFAVVGAKQEILGAEAINLGKISMPSKLAQAYSAADVFVLPSMQDNLPNMLAEATSCGAPTVAFNIGGIPEMIENGKTGFVVPAFDCHEFGVRIGQILSSQELAVAMSREARSKALGMYASTAVVPQYSEVYEAAIDAHKKPEGKIGVL